MERPALDFREDPVPMAVRGLWRRLSLERADGSGDVTTTVLWLQTERLYADIRLPAAWPNPAVAGFADLSVDDAVALARQEGFAGMLDWCGEAFRWRRAIDFRPTGQPDEGHCRRLGRVLVEHGLHEPYVEHWWQEPDEEAVTAGIEAGGTIVVTAGDHVMVAVDRRPASPPAGALVDLAADAARAGDAGRLEDLLDCEVAYARRIPGGGCTVALSTLPWTVGQQRPLPAALAHPEVACAS